MLLTVVISFLGGLAFRRGFLGSGLLFYVVVASLIMPSVVVSLGIGSLFELVGIERFWWNAGLGAHLTWTLPFGVLIMFAVFNRFDKRYEEAARDLGASPLQTVLLVILPIVAAVAGRHRPVRLHPLLRRARPQLARRWVRSTRSRSSSRRCRATPPRP